MLFGVISYFMIGFQESAEKFFIFLFVIILCANVGSAIGLLLGTVARTTSVAIALVPVSLIPFLIFSGFFVNSDSKMTFL
jgi:ABC-type transport system involved in multi-copper enzyme maturation permease subunit